MSWACSNCQKDTFWQRSTEKTRLYTCQYPEWEIRDKVQRMFRGSRHAQKSLHNSISQESNRSGKRIKRKEFLSKDRISVEGQIQLCVKRQIYAVSKCTFMQKRSNRQNSILVHIENSSFERNLQLGEVLGLL